ncbi:hypothetical protein Pfo_021435 [Paulownia fortunei]|nr:hypothetical protein Pfo_021435 [Paulownia fortunei]
MAENSPVLMRDYHFPLLMMPCIGYGNPYYSRFYSILGNNIHHKDLHELYKKRCLGSSHGWLIMAEDNSPSIFAVNPLENSTRIQLPSLLTLPDILDFNGDEYVYWTPFLGNVTVGSGLIKNTYLKKVFLSKDPTQEGCMAVAIFGELKRLAFCRVGDEEWKIIAQQDFIHGYQDVVFDQEGRFYALNFHGKVVTGDLESPFWDLFYEPLVPDYADKKYLVFDTKGQLMLINRYIGWKNYDGDDEEGESGCEEEIEESRYGFPYKTSRFKIIRLDEETGKSEEVDSLKDEVLFLGNNQSLCLSSLLFLGCKADCVYFTDDSLDAHMEPRIGGHDIGVFDLKNGCIERIQCIQNEDEGIWPPPIWVTHVSTII